MRMVQGCDAGEPEPTDPNELIGTYGRTCDEVNACMGGNAGPYCDEEGWDSLYLYPTLGNRDLDRVEAMLIMMQDMVDIAGHYAWRVGWFGASRY